MSDATGVDRDSKVPVVAYDNVFDYEYRVREIGDVRWPSPRGVAIRSVMYLIAAVVLIVLVLPSLPGVGLLVGLIPWWAQIIFVVIGSWGLAALQIEGLRFHQFFPVILRHWCRAKFMHGWVSSCRVGGRLRHSDVVFLADESYGQFKGLKVKGPCRIVRYKAALVRVYKPGVRDRFSDRPSRRYIDSGVKRGGSLISVPAGRSVEFGG